jgi:hypothetical protein
MKMDRRKCMALSHDEYELLRTLHRQSGIPDGQFPQRPAFWLHFTNVWNEATGRRDTAEDVLHYIMTKRKKGLWFRFDGKHTPLQCPEITLFTADQWALLDRLYVELGIGSDNFLTRPELRKELHARFCSEAHIHVPPLLFAAVLVAFRKGGYLSKTDPTRPNGGLGFNDINEVA